MVQTKVISARTRWYRKIHHWVGSFLFVFFLFVAVTGLLLGWKKNSTGYLLAKSYEGSSTDVSKWLSLDVLQKIATKTLHDSVDASLSGRLDRIDARPEKGMVKFIFKDHFKAIQLDAATGKVLHLEQRRADWIEKLHDGSIIDMYFDFSAQPVKLVYTTILGMGLLTLTISGFWLWYNPRRIRKRKSA
jgi:uncharacterized iron-regulated membrane protein